MEEFYIFYITLLIVKLIIIFSKIIQFIVMEEVYTFKDVLIII